MDTQTQGNVTPDMSDLESSRQFVREMLDDMSATLGDLHDANIETQLTTPLAVIIGEGRTLTWASAGVTVERLADFVARAKDITLWIEQELDRRIHAMKEQEAPLPQLPSGTYQH